MTTIKIPKVYQVTTLPPDPHQRMFLPPLFVGKELWCHGNRRSSLGGYIGTFSELWRDRGYCGPRAQQFEMLMEYVTPSE